RSSPNETGASPVTREADNPQIDGQPFQSMWNPDEGTLVIEYDNILTEGVYKYVLSVVDGTEDNAIWVRRAPSDVDQVEVRESGSLSSVNSYGPTRRVAVSFSGTEVSVSDGGSGAVNDTVSVPVGLMSGMYIGTKLGVNHGITRIPALYYYRERIPDKDLQRISVVGRNLITEPI